MLQAVLSVLFNLVLVVLMVVTGLRHCDDGIASVFFALTGALSLLATASYRSPPSQQQRQQTSRANFSVGHARWTGFVGTCVLSALFAPHLSSVDAYATFVEVLSVAGYVAVAHRFYVLFHSANGIGRRQLPSGTDVPWVARSCCSPGRCLFSGLLPALFVVGVAVGWSLIARPPIVWLPSDAANPLVVAPNATFSFALVPPQWLRCRLSLVSPLDDRANVSVDGMRLTGTAPAEGSWPTISTRAACAGLCYHFDGEPVAVTTTTPGSGARGTWQNPRQNWKILAMWSLYGFGGVGYLAVQIASEARRATSSEETELVQLVPEGI